MGVVAVGRVVGVVGLVVAAGTLGGCATRSEGALADGAASVSDDGDEPGGTVDRGEPDPDVEDAIEATQAVESADLSMQVQFGPQSFEIDGEWNDDGVGSSTARSDDGQGGEIELEVRADGETGWLTTDQPSFVAEMPDDVTWVEAPFDELVDAGIVSELEMTWDPLLFLHGLRSVTDEGVESVEGDDVRVLAGAIDYDATYDEASPAEQARMDVALTLHQGDVDFDARIGIDDDGRIRTLEYDITFSAPGADPDDDGASIPVRVSMLARSFDHEVSPPEPPDPDETVAAAEVPGALGQLGTSRNRSTSETTPTTGPTSDDDVPDPEGVIDRGPPSDPAPPPADTPPYALEVTTLIEGEGGEAGEGDTVIVHYVGLTADGTVIDSSWSVGQVFPLTDLGDAPVIQGWNSGLIGAREGERLRLVMGAELGYGSQGSGDIPPGAPLAFEIDVVQVVPG